MSLEDFYKGFIVISGLVITQLILGKKGAFPYGILFGLNLYLIAGVVILTDLVLMLFLEGMISVSRQRFKLFKIIHVATVVATVIATVGHIFMISGK